jgi:hypothetical protein
VAKRAPRVKAITESIPEDPRRRFVSLGASDRDRAREAYALTGNLADAARQVGYPYGVVNNAYKRDKGGIDDWDDFGLWYRDKTAEAIRKRFEGKIGASLNRALRTIAERLDEGDLGNPTSLVKELQALVQTYHLLIGEPTEHLKHSGELPDLPDPVALAERALRLAELAKRKQDDRSRSFRADSELDA